MAEDYKKFHVLDVRDAGQFAKDHVPRAVNIEWKARGGLEANARASKKG